MTTPCSGRAVSLRLQCLCVIGSFCVVSITTGADVVSELSEMEVAPGEWMLRLDNHGHEGTFGCELRSDGTIRRYGQGREESSGRVPKDDLAKAYSAARTIVRDFQSLDHARVDKSRDDDRGTEELTVVTANRSYRVWIKSFELDKDQEFAEHYKRLTELLKRNSPETDAPAAKRWTVVLDARRIDGNTLNSPYSYQLRVYETSSRERRLILDELEFDGRDEQGALQAASAILKRFELPPLDESVPTPPVEKPRSVVTIVIYDHTSFRGAVVRFGRQEAERLGVRKVVDNLIATVNRRLATSSSPLTSNRPRTQLPVTE